MSFGMDRTSGRMGLSINLEERLIVALNELEFYYV